MQRRNIETLHFYASNFTKFFNTMKIFVLISSTQ